MKTSSAGIDLICQFEGLREKAYRDPIGVWTIGYGHTSMAGPPKVTPGLTISKADAREILTSDLIKFESEVVKRLKRNPNDNQFDAMVSLCFNIGPTNFGKSSVLRYFNAGDASKAADSFRLWNKAGGKILPGLIRRREAERALFLTPPTQRQLLAPILGQPDDPGLEEEGPVAPSVGFWARLWNAVWGR